MIPARISMVSLGVRDLGASTSFYESLGWKKSSGSNEQITFIYTADSVLGLYGYDALAEDAVASEDWAQQPAGVALALNLESEEAVDAAATELNALGVKILKGPEKAFWGGYNFYFADPDGHRWEVAYNPYAKFDEAGSLTEI